MFLCKGAIKDLVDECVDLVSNNEDMELEGLGEF